MGSDEGFVEGIEVGLLDCVGSAVGAVVGIVDGTKERVGEMDGTEDGRSVGSRDFGDLGEADGRNDGERFDEGVDGINETVVGRVEDTNVGI